MTTPHSYLADLAHYIPCISAPQLLIHYFSGNRRQMNRALQHDSRRGLIVVSKELVRLKTNLHVPLITIPDARFSVSAEKLAYLSSKLWSEDVRPMTIIRGTAGLALISGGQINSPARGYTSHEIALTGVFLSKRNRDADFVWSLSKSRPGGGAVPDAVAANIQYEIIGRYGGSHLATKLKLAVNGPLELW